MLQDTIVIHQLFGNNLKILPSYIRQQVFYHNSYRLKDSHTYPEGENQAVTSLMIAFLFLTFNQSLLKINLHIIDQKIWKWNKSKERSLNIYILRPR